jgi:hypothetical protein
MRVDLCLNPDEYARCILDYVSAVPQQWQERQRP